MGGGGGQCPPTHPAGTPPPNPRGVLERLTAGGGPPPPLDLPPPALPVFQPNFASVPSVPRGFKLKEFRPALGGDPLGTKGGGGSSQTPSAPLLPNTSLPNLLSEALIDTMNCLFNLHQGAPVLPQVFVESDAVWLWMCS